MRTHAHTHTHMHTIIFLNYYLLALLHRWGNKLRELGYLLKVTRYVTELRFELKPTDLILSHNIIPWLEIRYMYQQYGIYWTWDFDVWMLNVAMEMHVFEMV